jgi:hypothetical protein
LFDEALQTSRGWQMHASLRGLPGCVNLERAEPRRVRRSLEAAGAMSCVYGGYRVSVVGGVEKLV